MNSPPLTELAEISPPKGGKAESKEITDLITKVKAAKTVDEYLKCVKPILDVVDKIEKIYTK